MKANPTQIKPRAVNPMNINKARIKPRIIAIEDDISVKGANSIFLISLTSTIISPPFIFLYIIYSVLDNILIF